jgi:hypothetical protein
MLIQHLNCGDRESTIVHRPRPYRTSSLSLTPFENNVGGRICSTERRPSAHTQDCGGSTGKRCEAHVRCKQIAARISHATLQETQRAAGSKNRPCRCLAEHVVQCCFRRDESLEWKSKQSRSQHAQHRKAILSSGEFPAAGEQRREATSVGA